MKKFFDITFAVGILLIVGMALLAFQSLMVLAVWNYFVAVAFAGVMKISFFQALAVAIPAVLGYNAIQLFGRVKMSIVTKKIPDIRLSERKMTPSDRAIHAVEIANQKLVTAYDFAIMPDRTIYFVVQFEGQEVLQDFSSEMTHAYKWIVGEENDKDG